MKTPIYIKDFAICNPKNSPLSNFEYINYIDTSSVTDGWLDNIQRLSSNYPSRAQRVILANDILISSVRPNLRHNYFINAPIVNGVASTGFVQVRITKESIALPKYLYYYLTTEKNVAWLSSIAETSQSTFPAFNKDVIENLEFPDISIADQDHIVDTKCQLVVAV